MNILTSGSSYITCQGRPDQIILNNKNQFVRRLEISLKTESARGIKITSTEMIHPDRKTGRFREKKGAGGGETTSLIIPAPVRSLRHHPLQVPAAVREVRQEETTEEAAVRHGHPTRAGPAIIHPRIVTGNDRRDRPGDKRSETQDRPGGRVEKNTV